jgi:hypothetical protein
MKTERLPGGSILRALLLVAVIAALGLSAGAVAPSSASADDDNGDNGGGNYHKCTGGTKTDTTVNGVFVQTCIITQSYGECIQRSSEPLLVQQCLVDQGPTVAMGMPKSNYLKVEQTADQHGAEGTLDATQIVDGPPLPLTPDNRGEQRNFGTANNTAYITQVIEQKLKAGIDDDDDGEDDDDNGEADEDDDGEDDDDNGETHGPDDILALIEQFEQAHQWVDLCQGGIPCDTRGAMTGRNRAVVYQSHESIALAANAMVIDQGQNTQSRRNECSPGPDPTRDDQFARACYTIKQFTGNATNNADNPANYSRLTQYATHLENARDCVPCTGGHQGQGWSDERGGIDHNFVQDSPGIARLFSVQEEYMTQRRTDTGAMTHHQVGNVRKGSGDQGTHSGSLADVFGDKDLYTGEVILPVQNGEARAFVRTSGECLVDLFVEMNEVSGEAHDGADRTPTGETCDEFVFCTIEGCISSDESFVTSLGVLAARP